MARVKRAVHNKKKHKAILEQAQGYYGDRSRTFKSANEAVMHAGNYAFGDRRARKGQFRRLWIQRINAACRQHGTSYSVFIAGLKRGTYVKKAVKLKRRRGRQLDVDPTNASPVRKQLGI